MIRKEIIEKSVNRCGGNGTVLVHKIVLQDEMNGKGRGVNLIELPPGTSIGHHPHLDSSEQFYVIEGEGMFDDNGTVTAIKAGETGVMAPGEYHGIENTGASVMKIIAVHTFA